jgi:isopentenyl diphosphate isomerase/L-lactate dehydrogenase-like FMN-dependent dehydrogenase
MWHRDVEFSTIAEARDCARRVLPRSLFEALCAGSGDNLTRADNEQAFREVFFRTSAAVTVGTRDIRATVLGTEISLPVLTAPTGGTFDLIHPDREYAIARATAAAGTIGVIAMSPREDEIEAIARAADGALWQQLYLTFGREYAESVIERAWASGYRALVVTVDYLVFGKPTLPPARFDLATAYRHGPELLMRPRWFLSFLRSGPRSRLKPVVLPPASEPQICASWHDFEWISDLWPGPVVIKGIMTSEDARRARDVGASAIVVSNHGGKALDGVPGSLRALPEVVAAVGDDVEVLLDGGVRQGADVVKALALGARAVLVGRPYLYGLAAGGESGIRRVLDIYRLEVETALGQLGCSSLEELDRSRVLFGPGDRSASGWEAS